MSINKTKYPFAKRTLAYLILSNATDEQIAKKYNISTRTALRWRERLIKEEGELAPNKKEEISREFIVKTIEGLNLAHSVAFRDMGSSEDNTRKNALHSFLKVIETQMNFYARYGIVPEKLSIDIHNETYNINHKELNINQVLEVLDKEEEDKKKKMEVMESIEGAGHNGK